MTVGFGSALTARAVAIARRGIERAGEAMIAAAEAELPPGISLGREDGNVMLTGQGIRARYWGTARGLPDAALRLLVSRMTQGRGQ